MNNYWTNTVYLSAVINYLFNVHTGTWLLHILLGKLLIDNYALKFVPKISFVSV